MREDNERPVRIRDAAFLAGLNPDTVRRWVRQGRIRAWGRWGYTSVLVSDLLPPIERKPSQGVTEKTVRKVTPAPGSGKP